MSDAKVVAGVSSVVDGADGVQRGRLTPPYPGAEGVRLTRRAAEVRLGAPTPAFSSLWWLEAHVGLQLVGLLACPRDGLFARYHGTSVLKGAAYVLRGSATSTAFGFLTSAEP